MFIWTLRVNLCRVQVHYGTVLLFFHCLLPSCARHRDKNSPIIQFNTDPVLSGQLRYCSRTVNEDRAEQRLRMCRDRRGLGTKQRSFAKGFSKQRHILAFLRWQTMMSWTCAVHYSALTFSRSTEVGAHRI